MPLAKRWAAFGDDAYGRSSSHVEDNIFKRASDKINGTLDHTDKVKDDEASPVDIAVNADLLDFTDVALMDRSTDVNP